MPKLPKQKAPVGQQAPTRFSDENILRTPAKDRALMDGKTDDRALYEKRVHQFHHQQERCASRGGSRGGNNSLKLTISVPLNTELNSVLKYALRMLLSPKLSPII